MTAVMLLATPAFAADVTAERLPLDYDPNRDIQVYSGKQNMTLTDRTKTLCPSQQGGSYRRILVTEGVRRQRFELAI